MDIFVVSGSFQLDPSLEWVPASGSSLNDDIHQVMKDGSFVLTRAKQKIKLFKNDGTVKSILFTGESLDKVVADHFIGSAKLEKMHFQKATAG